MIGLKLLDGILSFFSDDAASICTEAAEIYDDNGFKRLDYNGGGWFTEPSCTTECQNNYFREYLT